MLGFIALRKFTTKKPNFGRSVYIVAGKRTPIGTFMGKLSTFKATELSSITIKGALESINLPKDKVEEVILGNVISAGLGQCPARQASLGAGLSHSTRCTTINKACSSGMKSVVYGTQSIALGDSDIVVTGGFENMSQAPHMLPNLRIGHSFGPMMIVDLIANDGMTDAFRRIPIGKCAEKTAEDFNITREMQDEYSINSYEKLMSATKESKLFNQILPIKLNDNETLYVDEEQHRYNRENIRTFRPAFSRIGTITMGNSAKISDGACSLILVSETALKKYKLKPLAKIISYADCETEPIDFCIASTKSSQLALSNIGMNINDIDYFEINEIFAVAALANIKLMDIEPNIVNVNGGTIAIGHPLGASGARIILSLIDVLKQNKGKLGLASISNGGGGATSIVIENID